MSKAKKEKQVNTADTVEQISFFDIELPPIDQANAIQDTPAQDTPATTPINFAKVPDSEYKDFPKIPLEDKPSVDKIIKLMDKAAYKVGRHELLSDVFECGAIAISNQFDWKQAADREAKYLQIIKKYDKASQMLIVEIFTEIYRLLSNMINPQIGFADYLGELYMRSETSNSKAGQFFTPYSVSKMCAKVAINDGKVNECIEQDRILTVNEPTCGAGGMILAAADVLYNEYHFNFSRNLLVICSDIDSRCVHMTYLQLALAGIPAVVYQQNTLTLETWQEWKTPAYLMQWARFKNALKNT